MKKIIVFVFLNVFFSLNAQNSFRLNIGSVFPLGEFADSYIDDNEWGLLYKSESGGAGLGFDVGFEYDVQFKKVEGLYMMFNVDFLVNQLNRDLLDWKEERLDIYNFGDNEYSVSLPKYINIPIMLGLNYTYGLASKMDLYGDVACGINVQKVTNLSEYYKNIGSASHGAANYRHTEEININNKYYMNCAMAFKIGFGLTYNKRFSAGISFWNLGSYTVKGNKKTERLFNCPYEGENKSNNYEKFKLRKINPQMILLRCGIIF